MRYTIIKTNEQYDEYCNLLHQLVKSKNTIDSDDVEMLTLLTGKWENETIERNDLDPVQLIRELLFQSNMNATEFGNFLNLSKGTVSKMLNYNKGISKDSIRKIAERFQISQASLNKHYELNTYKKSEKLTSKNSKKKSVNEKSEVII